MSNPKKQQHQGRVQAKDKPRDGLEPNSSRTSKSSGLSPCLDEEHDTSDICCMCQRQLMRAVVEVTEV
jgi:hypothetical protein